MSSLALAGDDVRAPSSVAIDGGMQFWAGLCFGSASFVNYLVLSGTIHLPHPGLIGLVWMAATAGFILFGLVFKVGTDRAQLQDPAFRRFRALWGTLIIGAMIMVGTLILLMSRFGIAEQSSFVVSPINLCIYGIGWRLVAVTSGRKWPNLLSLGCFVCAPLLAFLAGTPTQSLVYTGCLIVFAVIPGLALLLRSGQRNV